MPPANPIGIDRDVPTDVRLAESALADLQAVEAWYAEQGVPDVGTRLVADIVASIERLADHPGMGRVVPEFGQISSRELIRPPLRIVYRYESNSVRVARVWRSERQLHMPGGEDGTR